MLYDVVIVGAGPAGATLARTLGGRYRVLLIDRRPLEPIPGDGRGEKCCGGLIAPDAQKALAALGLGLPGEVLVGPQLFAVRAIDLPARLERFYQRHYINVDRARFDRWLRSLLPGEVDLRGGCAFKAFQRRRGGIDVHLVQRGRPTVARTRVLVGADGAGSPVRARLFGGRRAARTYLAIQEWFEAGESPPWYGAIFDPEVTDFYAWTIPKDGRLILGAAVRAGGEARRKFARLKRRIGGVGIDLGRSIRLRGAKLVRPASLSEICLGRGPVALVGEAAGWISPSSGEGLSYALASASLLADVLAEGFGDVVRRYRRRTRRLRATILAKLVKCRVTYNPAARRLVMLSGAGSMGTSTWAAPAARPLLPRPAPVPLPPGVL